MRRRANAMTAQSMDASRPKADPVRSYRTRFEHDEAPISEGGMWLNGRKDGVDWCDVLVKDGHAYGEITRMAVAERRAEQDALGAGASEGGAAEGDYDDPTAVLAGPWGRNQFGRATVYSRNPTNRYFQEVEIRLRSSITPNSCTGYEVFFRCLKTDEGYAEIVRWNGRIGDWTSLNKRIGSEYGVKDGDVIEASIVGDQIRGYINGVEVISATDDKFPTGSPGIGFNFFVGDTNVDHGLSSFEVDTYDD
jgi:hypothetical protein